MHYKLTDSQSYLLYSSSHPSHVKNSIPYSRRLCSDDSDFSSKSEEMCQFFEKRGYPVSLVKAGHHHAQQFDRQSSLQTSQKDKNDRIPFTLTFNPDNHAVKSIILNNFKLLQNDPETGRIFSQPPLISFKRDKNVGNFLVRSALKTNEQPVTFKCARSRCKTCLFIVNTSKISGPKRSVMITDRFTCTSANVIYCITCTLCNKLYIGETGRRLADRFREHLRDVEKNEKDACKPVAKITNSNLPLDFDPSIPNYRFEYVPAPQSAAGVGMYIHNDFNYTVIERTCDEAFQALWVEIHIAKKSTVILELFVDSTIAQKNVSFTLSKLLKNSVLLGDGFS